MRTNSLSFGAAMLISLRTIKDIDQSLDNRAKVGTLADFPQSFNKFSPKVPELICNFTRKTLDYPYTLRLQQAKSSASIIDLSIIDNKRRKWTKGWNRENIQICAHELIKDNVDDVLINRFLELKKAMEENPIKRAVRMWIKNLKAKPRV